MRLLLKLEDAYSGYEHHDFFLEEQRPRHDPEDFPGHYSSLSANSTTTTNSSSARSRPACNKQTINAGDNPCPSFQSPLPYMLAGLAAMVLLVVISLMILACSYLRGYFSGEENGEQSGSGGEAQGGSELHPMGSGAMSNPKAAGLFASEQGLGSSPEKIVVILAGQEKPTHLAQPVELPKHDDPHKHQVESQSHQGQGQAASQISISASAISNG